MFLAAARDGDFDRLVAVLDPDVVLRQDFGPVGGSREVRGAAAVAGQALGYAQIGLDVRPRCGPERQDRRARLRRRQERLRELDLTILD